MKTDKSTAQLKLFVRKLPKIELHLHLEGSVPPGLLARIAEKRCSASPQQIKALYEFDDFRGFLQSYRRVVELLTRPEDFYQVAGFLFRKLEAQGILYAEITFTPLIHLRRGLKHAEVMGCILRAVEQARRRSGLRIGFIYDTVRQWGKEAALETAELAAADRRAGLPVVGFGVGGDELGAPVDQLVDAFELAGSAGLRKHVHAGEVGGAESVWEALEVLGAERIGHGISALSKPKLLETLAERGIALDICPTSNVMTGAVASFEEHPLPRLIAAGVPVTLGSDDPGFFGVWLEDEIERSMRKLALSPETVEQLMQQAVRHSFLDPEEKKSLLQAWKARNTSLLPGP